MLVFTLTVRGYSCQNVDKKPQKDKEKNIENTTLC